MTDEQIKQKADIYADKLYKDGRCIESTAPTIQEIYIAGAHSRDEEIESLQRRVSMWKHEAEVVVKELNKLRNPCINAEERLPDEDPNNKGYSIKVIGFFPSGCISDCFCSIEEDIWFIDGLTCDKPAYWMSIPKLQTTNNHNNERN